MSKENKNILLAYLSAFVSLNIANLYTTFLFRKVQFVIFCDDIYKSLHSFKREVSMGF